MKFVETCIRGYRRGEEVAKIIHEVSSNYETSADPSLSKELSKKGVTPEDLYDY